jgi:arylsulfatase A-like enzyme
LTAIDQEVGADHLLVVLTADHGVQPLVETLQKKGIPARQVRPEEIEKPVRSALEQSFPLVPGLIAFFNPPDFYLDHAVLQKAGLSGRQVEKVMADALQKTGLVARVFKQDDLLSPPSLQDPIACLFFNSYFPPRSPQLVVCLKESYYLSERSGGTGHGTPYEYDRHVPLVFLGMGIKPGNYPEPCGPEDIAPTLAKFLGLSYPIESDSRLLREILPGQ